MTTFLFFWAFILVLATFCIDGQQIESKPNYVMQKRKQEGEKKNSASIQVNFLSSSWHLQLYLVLLCLLLCCKRAAWSIQLLLQLLTSKPGLTCYRLYPKKTSHRCQSVCRARFQTNWQAEIKPWFIWIFVERSRICTSLEGFNAVLG